MAHAVREAISRRTFVEFGGERLSALCDAAGDRSALEELSRLFSQLSAPWGQDLIGAAPRYPSNVADDQAPFEFSIAFSGGAPEVQFYVEPLGEPPSLESNMVVGRALLDAVAAQLGLPLRRLHAVADLFFPPRPQGAFTLWIGVSSAAGRAAQFKVYLNPQVQGPELSSQVVSEAMSRLGFAEPWAQVQRTLSRSPERLDELAILSLDLCDGDDARVKVYVRQHAAMLRDISALSGMAADARQEDVASFYSALAGSDGPFLRKPVITELAFTDPGAARPAFATLEFPIGSYVATDQIASERIERCLKSFGLPTGTYRAAISGFATRPLQKRAGIHAHVTLRRVRDRPRVGIYFASEAYVSQADQKE